MKEKPDPSVVECEIFIAAAPETVFQFLVKPELMERWIGKSLVSRPLPQQPYSIEMDSGHVARGVYETISPPRRIAFTWGWDGQAALPPGASFVEIELVPQDGGTLVRLRHSELPEDAPPVFSPASHREHWLRYLARLKAVAELDGGRNAANRGNE